MCWVERNGDNFVKQRCPQASNAKASLHFALQAEVPTSVLTSMLYFVLRKVETVVQKINLSKTPASAYSCT